MHEQSNLQGAGELSSDLGISGRRSARDTDDPVRLRLDTPLPGGTVTFVFTDIEGSTRLLQRIGDRYTGVLGRHRELLRGAVASQGGVEVDSEGDGLFFAFAGAKSAIAACIAGQRALLTEPWPSDVTVRVRMWLHTGEAMPSNGGGYVALAVHQAARVASAAHGGQVLVSDTTASAVAEALPVSASMQKLGAYCLAAPAGACCSAPTAASAQARYCCGSGRIAMGTGRPGGCRDARH